MSEGEGHTSPTLVVDLEESIDNNASASIPTPNTTDAGGSRKAAKPPKLRSKAWDHFMKFTDPKDGELKGKCNYCDKIYLCSSERHGTSTLNNHVTSCVHNPNNVDAQQGQLFFKSCESKGSLSTWKFDQSHCRKKLISMIVRDKLPFQHVDGEGFIDFVEALQPRFTIPSRWTVSRDIHQLYLDEKVKLQEFFKTYGGTVCITTDTWTSVQKINYMCITAHYVDKDWALNKKIINLCVVDSHKGDEMGRQIDFYLREWGIVRVFAVAVDNVAANDVCVNCLKGRLIDKPRDVVKGEHLHIRCTAHVVNLIVGNGLKVINQSIKRVRGAIRYVRHSPARLKRFRECCVDEGIECKYLLCLDVATRWNSTYLMLSIALKFEKAFERFEGVDPFFRVDLTDMGLPTPVYWEVVRTIIDILVVFYELTLRVSAQLYVTSHLLFHEIDTIGNLLKDWVESPNPAIKDMAVKMLAKYNKYWGEPTKMNKLIYLAVVIDPRYKFAFINYYFREEFGDDEGPKMASEVKECFTSFV